MFKKFAINQLMEVKSECKDRKPDIYSKINSEIDEIIISLLIPEEFTQKKE